MGRAKISGRDSKVTQKVRMLDGVVVQSVKFVGHTRPGYGGTYMAGRVNDVLIVDDNGKPIPFSRIGELV